MKQTREGGYSTHFKMGKTKATGVATPTQVCSLTCRDERFLNTAQKVSWDSEAWFIGSENSVT